MSKYTIKMVYFGEALFVDVELWNNNTKEFNNTSLTFDTGAVTTTISSDILFLLGCDMNKGQIARIVTASGVEYVREVIIDKFRIGNFELKNIKVYAHSFPLESFSSGVIGLNILSQFDIKLLFSKRVIELNKLKGE